MRTIFLSCAIALAAGSWIGTVPAAAQVPPGCPPGYYLAQDGQCYPGTPPVYPAPLYDVGPPIVAPPVILDFFDPGIGYGGHDFGGHGGPARGAPGRGAPGHGAPGGGPHR